MHPLHIGPGPPSPVPAAPATIRNGALTESPVVPAGPDGAVAPAQLAKLRQAAQDFEAMALGQMLAPMFDTVDSAHGAFGGGSGEAMFRPMLVDAIAKQIAAHGGLGLAAPVFASLLRAQESAAAGGRPKEAPR